MPNRIHQLPDSEDAVGETLRIASDKTGRLDRFNERLSEWCSSILVKETRQALKSRQFLWTYFLLLGAVGLWAIIGIAFRETDLEYGNAGRDLLYGLFLIMGFPLGIIIPFGAYRSLAREYEDGTIQLISITTMRPSQIVMGKFGSAILQMLVYLSVLAPCILFTYLLRGISLPQILWGLFICVGFSICLTILGLFLAGAIRSRALGVGVSVLFVLLLGWLYWCWSELSEELVRSSMSGMDDPQFISIVFCIVSLLGSTALLLLVAASSQISFDSDNRSTWVRLAMLVQQVLFWGFVVVMTQFAPFPWEAVMGFVFVSTHYWLIMGFLMIGESPQISRRVQRTLPATYVSRSLVSFLMPGPGRGFLFALTMMAASGAAVCLISSFHEFLILDAVSLSPANRRNMFGGPPTTPISIYTGTAVCCCYGALFLSISFLFAKWRLHKGRFEWSAGMGPAISLLIGVVLVALITIGSLVCHFSFTGFRSRADYSLFETFNWYWTTAESFNPAGSSLAASMIGLLLIGASPIILWAFVLASRELLSRPIPVPERVQVDQQKPVLRLPVGESIDEIFGEIT